MKYGLSERFGVMLLLVRKYGVLGLLKLLWTDVLFDYRFGVDTYAPVAKAELFEGKRLELQNRYVPSTFAVVEAGLAEAAALIGQDFSKCGFIDYGSGKGKVLIASARHGFPRSTGIEYSLELHRIAEKNMTKLGLDSAVKLIHGDAAQFHPAADDRVLYFFNPFMGEILEECLLNIKAVKPTGRRVLILFNPVEDERMSRHFKKVKEALAQPGDIRFCVYEG